MTKNVSPRRHYLAVELGRHERGGLVELEPLTMPILFINDANLAGKCSVRSVFQAAAAARRPEAGLKNAEQLYVHIAFISPISLKEGCVARGDFERRVGHGVAARATNGCSRRSESK